MGDNFDSYSDSTEGKGMKLKDHPRQASLLHDLYQPLPAVSIVFGESNALDTSGIADQVLGQFSSALGDGDQESLQALFYQPQSFYRDTLAFTYHNRTFKQSEVIAAVLTDLSKARAPRAFQLTPGPLYHRVLPTLVGSSSSALVS